VHDPRSPDAARIPINLKSEIGGLIAELVNGQGMKLEKIELVIQTALWSAYVAQRTLISSRGDANEVFLYHGTPPETVEKIVSEGFVRDHNSRAVFGKGVYFARDLFISRDYARMDRRRRRFVFLSRVLMGASEVGGNNKIVGHNPETGMPFTDDGEQFGESFGGCDAKGFHCLVAIFFFFVVLFFFCSPEFLLTFR
jgi:hypothetical protein